MNIKSRKAEVQESIKASIEANKLIRRRGTSWNNHSIAEITTQEDCNYFGDTGIYYDLNEDVRDRIIVHIRQDAAHALLNTHSLLKENRYIKIILLSILILNLLIARKIGLF